MTQQMPGNRSSTKRSSKFPLTLHPTGQYCKKIRGRMHYFGKDRREALRLYFERASVLHMGKDAPVASAAGLTLRNLCNMYLEHQESRVAIGEIKHRYYYDQRNQLRDFAKFIGADERISEISALRIQGYRQRLIKAEKAPRTINNTLAAIKAMFNWATENELIDRGPNLKAIKKVSIRPVERRTFTAAEVQLLLKNAGLQMRAMILLGMNCGFGCTDCAELRWSHLDLDSRRVNFPRGKTDVGRNLALWPDTAEALEVLPKRGDLVFYTSQGNPWVRPISGGKAHDNAISKEFSKLMHKVGITAEKGTGFYTLRRTAATVAAETGDIFAVQRLLGHADTKMASTYVQNVSEQVDRAISHTREWLAQQLKVRGDSSPSGSATSEIAGSDSAGASLASTQDTGSGFSV